MIYFIQSTCKSLTHVVMKPESDRFMSVRMVHRTLTTDIGHYFYNLRT